MEMCYDGALVMPKNFAVVNEEEMTYVDGGAWGWGTYTGIQALVEISIMAGCAVGAGVLAGKLIGFSAGCAATGAGVIAAIAAALGASFLVGLSGYNTALAMVAATLFAESWARTGSFSKAGFKAYSIGVYNFSTYTMVKKL